MNVKNKTEMALKRNANNKNKIPSKVLQKCKQKKKTMTHIKYDPQRIVNTMGPVESGTMNVTEASKVFDIQRQTPSDRIKGKYTKAGGGRKTELTKDEVKILVDYCMFMAKCSHPLTVPVIKGFILQMIQVGSGGKVSKRDILRYLYENQIISIEVDPG